MSRYVGQYISTCDLCLQIKPICHLSLRELYLLPVPNIKQETISVDFVVKIYKSVGFNMIITVVDLVSKGAHFILTHTMVTIEGTIRLFLYYIWKLHSLPNCIISNRGLQFMYSSPKSYIVYLELKLLCSLLWQPLSTKLNNYTSSKSLSRILMQES